MAIKGIQNVQFKGKKVLIRVDFNVPLNQNQEIVDDTRIRESLPTIQKVINDGGIAILMSHLGRPKGHEPSFSLMPIAIHLTKLLNKNVVFDRVLFDPVRTKNIIDSLEPGSVALLENLRFYPQEEAADETFAKQLASLADVYVNDAFGTAHREHCSTATVARYFKEKYAGLLMEQEITNLEKVLSAQKRPFTTIIGGAKVSTKINVLRNFIGRADNIIIGGGMAYTFIKALGGQVGDSLYEEDKIEETKEAIAEMMRKGVNVYLPVDTLISDSFSNDGHKQFCNADEIPDKWMGLDIGPRTIRRFAEIINTSETILWNGPMGVYELDSFKQGTKAVAISVAGATLRGAFSLVGGGDSVAAINNYNLADQVSYVSTGGGAMLEYLEGKELPAIKALKAE